MFHGHSLVQLPKSLKGEYIIDVIRHLAEANNAYYVLGDFYFNTFRLAGGRGQGSDLLAQCFVVTRLFERGKPQGGIVLSGIYHEVVVANCRWSNSSAGGRANHKDYFDALASYVDRFKQLCN